MRRLVLLLVACAEPSPPIEYAPPVPTDAGLVRDGGFEPFADDDLVVMTWNLRTFPLTATTARVVGEVLAEHRPDLVGLQEIGAPELFDELIDGLPGYEGLLANDPAATIRVALLYRPERVEIDEVSTLFVEDWYAFPRPPLAVRVTTRGARPIDLRLLVVHHKALSDQESRRRRAAASRKLDDWCREALRGPEPDVLVIGDMNDRITDPREENVFNFFLDRPDLYRFLTYELERDHRYSHVPFRSFIDHILITKEADEEYVEGSAGVLDLDKTIPRYLGEVSDHLPVHARFRFSR